ncbi:hypothetical protein [Rhizobium chutanense]|uniref:Uncharacterized protein n=1 Tax=Rhizobium chutanense TaxID=2035448 RepID=A0A432P1G6_9HYPH|nr:hypothetical protein [Rhizobium chutanense]RUM05633.1 hypothetical protein EFR84_16075 [Rhizobium chutanense]
MTKRMNLVCLVAFFFCFAGAYAVQLLNGGVENTHGIYRSIYTVLWFFIIALLPFSVCSYLATQSWRELRQNKEKREFILKNPILAFLIWREEIDGE